MGVYDNFLARDNGMSKFGRLLDKKKNNYFLRLIEENHFRKPEEIKILEIGPGKGGMAMLCKQKKLEYIAIEANEKMYSNLCSKGIEVYHKKVPPIEIDRKFDVIFMNQVLEHMESRKQVLDLFSECKKHLTENGFLMVSVPDIKYWKEDFFASDYTHNSPFSLYSLTQVFLDSGFTVKTATVLLFPFRGNFFAALVWLGVRIFYYTGIIKLIFGKKSFKIKNLANASCFVVGENPSNDV